MRTYSPTGSLSLSTIISRYPAVKLSVGIAAGITLAPALPEVLWLAAAVSVLAGVCLVAFCPRPQLVSFAYWCAALTAGALIGTNARRSFEYAPAYKPSGEHPAPFGEIKAVFQGEITSVLRRDSTSLRCVAEGILDAQALPPFRCRVALTVSGTQNRQDSLAAGAVIYAPVMARLPRPAELPTDFNERLYYASLDVRWLLRAESARLGVRDTRFSFQYYADKAAEELKRRLRALFPPATAEFAVALVTGDRAGLSAATQREYALAGTSHILAVSGLHIGLLATILLVPLGLARNPWFRFFLFTTAVGAFVWVSGASPPAVRAGVMAALAAFVRAAQREARLANILAAAVLCQITADASLLYSVGFRLSAAAVAGIALLYDTLETALGRAFGVGSEKRVWRRFLTRSVALTLAASCATSIIGAWHFRTTSLVSPVANLAVVPLSSAAMAYTAASLVFSFVPVVGVWCASLLAGAAHAFLSLTGEINSFVAVLPFASVEGERAFFVAVVVSISTVYCAFARETRAFFFRTSASVAAIVLGVLAFPSDTLRNEPARIAARERFVVAFVPAGRHSTALVLQDRRHDIVAASDKGFERFVEYYARATGDTLLFFVSGTNAVFEASRLAPAVPNAGVVAVTLSYKNRRFFEALDSLDARGIRVVNGERFLRRDSLLRFTSEVGWNVWSNELRIGQKRVFLPRERVNRSAE